MTLRIRKDAESFDKNNGSPLGERMLLMTVRRCNNKSILDNDFHFLTWLERCR